MSGSIDYLFGAASFMPHGYCLLWRPDLVAMHGIADLATAFAYFSIPIAIHVFIRRRGDIEFSWLAGLFIAFITACGLTHLVGLATLWYPVYGLEAFIKMFTAVISVITALSMWPLLPKVLTLPSPAQLCATNADLEAQIEQRETAERQLREAHDELERRVAERTQQLQEAHDQLREREHHSRLLYQQTPAFMHAIDEDGRLQAVSNRWLRRMGYHREEVIDKPVEAFLDADSVQRLPEVVESLWRQGRIEDQPCRFVRKDGSTFDVLLSAIVDIGPDKKREGFAVLTDLTEQLRVKAALKKSVEELERSNADLLQFAYVASHDLRSPLDNIDDLARWTLEDFGDQLPAEGRENLVDLGARVDRMRSLLDSVLDYSRVGHAQDDLKLVDSALLARQAADMVNMPDEFSIAIDDRMPVFETHPVQLQQVLVNLVSNAVKHHDRAEGRIEISGRECDGLFEFRVADDGPGIPPDFHERVFKMFETLRPRDEIEGSGIGLAIVKKLIERHGGTAWIEPSPDDARGTVFAFTWRAGDVDDLGTALPAVA